MSPDSLNDGMVNQEYSQDLTFYLPLDTLVDVDGFGETLIVFEDYHITSISLPLGLTWECNNFESQCHYNPTLSQYGCVSIIGTPLEFGEFEVEVTVIATHALSWAVGTETISFVLPFNIIPNSSNNAGFVMTNFSGCAPLTVDFINNNTDLESYYWDFGNGNENTLENPPSQLYSEAGVYEVHYMAYNSLETLYFLTDIQINSASGWGGDAEDFLGDPDPYFKLFDGSGNQIFQSNIQVDNNFPVSWSMDNISMSNQTYSIEVWDEDGVFTSDDNLGSVSFNGNSSSSTVTNGDLSITYTMLEVESAPIADVVDTIYVFETPDQPLIVFDEISSSINCLSDSLDMSYQWYYNDSPVPNANALSFSPTTSGFYYLLATNEFGCSASSEEQMLTICEEDYVPEITISQDTLSSVQLSSLNYQWLYEGQILLDATSSILVATEQGSYSLILSDEWGCKYSSEELIFNFASVIDYTSAEFSVFPNPASSYIDVSLLEGLTNSTRTIELYDMQGRQVMSREMRCTNLRLAVSSLLKGSYILTIHSNGQKLSKRITIY